MATNFKSRKRRRSISFQTFFPSGDSQNIYPKKSDNKPFVYKLKKKNLKKLDNKPLVYKKRQKSCTPFAKK
jgi:hypothetical protein